MGVKHDNHYTIETYCITPFQDLKCMRNNEQQNNDFYICQVNGVKLAEVVSKRMIQWQDDTVAS